VHATEAPVHHFFSELLEREVVDKEGTPVGDLVDIAFTLQDHYPRATHLVVRRGVFRRSYASIPWARIEKLSLNFNLDLVGSELAFDEARPPHEFTLVRDILEYHYDSRGERRE